MDHSDVQESSSSREDEMIEEVNDSQSDNDIKEVEPAADDQQIQDKEASEAKSDNEIKEVNDSQTDNDIKEVEPAADDQPIQEDNRVEEERNLKEAEQEQARVKVQERQKLEQQNKAELAAKRKYKQEQKAKAEEEAKKKREREAEEKRQKEQADRLKKQKQEREAEEKIKQEKAAKEAEEKKEKARLEKIAKEKQANDKLNQRDTSKNTQKQTQEEQNPKPNPKANQGQKNLRDAKEVDKKPEPARVAPQPTTDQPPQDASTQKVQPVVDVPAATEPFAEIQFNNTQVPADAVETSLINTPKKSDANTTEERTPPLSSDLLILDTFFHTFKLLFSSNPYILLFLLSCIALKALIGLLDLLVSALASDEITEERIVRFFSIIKKEIEEGTKALKNLKTPAPVSTISPASKSLDQQSYTSISKRIDKLNASLKEIVSDYKKYCPLFEKSD